MHPSALPDLLDEPAMLGILLVLILLTALGPVGAELSLGGEVNLRVEWQLDLSSMNLVDAAKSSPTVCDVDGDGHNEIVIAYSSPDDRLVCVSRNGEVEWTYPPLSEVPLGDDVVSTPMVYDVDDDWVSEIVFGTRDAILYCVDGRGSLEWKRQMDAPMIGPVVSHDVTGDGYYEMFLGSSDQRLYSIDHSGEIIWQSFDLGGRLQGAPVLWDFDRDENVELIAVTQAGNIFSLGAAMPTEEWRFNAGAPVNTTPVIVDANQDEEYEILVGNDDGNYFCISFYGTELWRFASGTSVRMNPPVGDVDGDGSKDVVLMNDNMLYCLDGGVGSRKWTFEPMNPSGTGNQMVLGDVTGDGEVDIVTGKNPLYILDSSGELQSMFAPSESAWLELAPAICDLDDDGKVDIVAKFRGDDLYVLTTGGDYHPETMIWPTAFRNRRNNQAIPLRECAMWEEEISRLFARAFRHMAMAEGEGMEMERMRAYYSVAEDFWRDCDYAMTRTYLEGILEIKIPQAGIIPGLGGLLLSAASLVSRKRDDQSS